jgi:hypothetical protein
VSERNGVNFFAFTFLGGGGGRWIGEWFIIMQGMF